MKCNWNCNHGKGHICCFDCKEEKCPDKCIEKCELYKDMEE